MDENVSLVLLKTPERVECIHACDLGLSTAAQMALFATELSLMVCSAVISTLHPSTESQSAFSHPMDLKFLKGQISEFPPLDLNLIVSVLLEPSFEPMAIVLSLANASENVALGGHRLSEDGRCESSTDA